MRCGFGFCRAGGRGSSWCCGCCFVRRWCRRICRSRRSGRSVSNWCRWCGVTATAFEISRVPAAALEREAGRGQLLGVSRGAAFGALREWIGRHFLHHVIGMAARGAFVGINRHGNFLKRQLFAWLLRGLILADSVGEMVRRSAIIHLKKYKTPIFTGIFRHFCPQAPAK